MSTGNNEEMVNNSNMSLLLTLKDDGHSNQSEKVEENTNIPIVLARTMNEKLCFQTIESTLNKLKITIQKIKDSNALYIVPEDEWKQKVNNYMQETCAFSFIDDMMSGTLNNQVKDSLISVNNRITDTLYNLHSNKAISEEQYKEMLHNNKSTIINVNKLDFVAEIHNNEISIQPKVSHSVEQPINAIASFVNNILEPLIDAVIHTSFTFSSAVGTIRELEKYAKKGALQPTTYFVKIDIHDLTTTLPHHLLIETLERFLRTYLRSEEMDGIPITTIVQLVQLLLENQFYTYENKLYHQTIGGSISSSLIKGLVDIYLHHLTHNLYSKLFNKKELVGRCFNQIFFTWNGSKEELYNLLKQINFLRSKHINIQMTTTIGSTIEYLDAHISNDQGILKTKVYHDTNLEPYALPYILNCNNIKSNDHDILMFGALARALLYCYNIDEFNSERLYIESSFQINGASIDFIQNSVHNFLNQFNLTSINDEPLTDDTFQKSRQNTLKPSYKVNKYILQARQKDKERKQRQKQRRQQTKASF